MDEHFAVKFSSFWYYCRGLFLGFAYCDVGVILDTMASELSFIVYYFFALCSCIESWSYIWVYYYYKCSISKMKFCYPTIRFKSIVAEISLRD